MKRKMLLTALGAVIAIGSSGIVFAAPATNPSSMGMTQKQAPRPGSDAWITARIRAELSTAHNLSASSVQVTTNNGVVKLSGALDNKAQVKQTVAIAKSVKGVRRVDSTGLRVHA